MERIGLRELRQHASELVRRAEEGEELLVTVSGRPAVLGPATPTRWRRYQEIETIFQGPADPAWATDRERIDQTLGDALAPLTRAVLDTSVLIAADVPPLDGELAVSVASVAELHFGVLVTDDVDVRAERVRRLALIEHLYTPLPIDAAVARSYGHLAATVARQGRQPRAPVMDLLIAATAHAHDASLVTRNAGDLRGIEHLVEVIGI